MLINSVQNYSFNTNFPNFKSVYPVRFWVREKGGGGYAPVMTKEMSKMLGTKLVNILNQTRQSIDTSIAGLEKQKMLGKSLNSIEKKLAKLEITKKIKRFVARYDKDYVKSPRTRAFNADCGKANTVMLPYSYLMTGADASIFDERFGKPIGSLKSKLGNNVTSAELRQAQADYWSKGLNYVRNRAKAFLISGEPSEMHIKMETVRSKTGTIQGYNITGIGFFPQKGPKNPLEMTEWLKKS